MLIIIRITHISHVSVVILNHSLIDTHRSLVVKNNISNEHTHTSYFSLHTYSVTLAAGYFWKTLSFLNLIEDKGIIKMPITLPNHIVAERSGTSYAFISWHLKIWYKLDLQFMSTNQTEHDCGLVKMYDLFLKSTEWEMYCCKATGNC